MLRFERKTTGIHRTVYLVGGFAIKVLNGRYGFSRWLEGWLANRSEVGFYRAFGRNVVCAWWLCPVRWSLLGGLVVVMPRLETYVEENGFDAKHSHYLFSSQFEQCYGFLPPVEAKADSFGMLCGLVQIVDYGSPSTSDWSEWLEW